MMSATNQNRYRPLALGLALLACLLAALMRLYPPEWNFVPVGALALFAGARLRSWVAFALPLALMAATDALLAWRHGYAFLHTTTPFVYGSFLLNVLLGRLLTRTENPVAIAGAAVAASLQFFLVTNFGVWLTSVLLPGDPHSYPATLAGLLTCYEMGLPFYRGTFAGDMLFTAVFFGAHAWLTRWYFYGERVRTLALAEGDPRP